MNAIFGIELVSIRRAFSAEPLGGPFLGLAAQGCKAARLRNGETATGRDGENSDAPLLLHSETDSKIRQALGLSSPTPSARVTRVYSRFFPHFGCVFAS
jgi:hypothetical protein